MKVIQRKSKLWKLWNIIFPQADMEHVYIAFGDIVFTPGETIANDLVVHEAVHHRQQKHSYVYAIWWYIKYVLSSKFRLSQEIEAYGEHIKYLVKVHKNKPFDLINQIARILAGGMYRSVGSYQEIYKQLKDYTKLF